jgi:hypothetical protein
MQDLTNHMIDLGADMNDSAVGTNSFADVTALFWEEFGTLDNLEKAALTKSYLQIAFIISMCSQAVGLGLSIMAFSGVKVAEALADESIASATAVNGLEQAADGATLDFSAAGSMGSNSSDPFEDLAYLGEDEQGANSGWTATGYDGNGAYHSAEFDLPDDLFSLPEELAAIQEDSTVAGTKAWYESGSSFAQIAAIMQNGNAMGGTSFVAGMGFLESAGSPIHVGDMIGLSDIADTPIDQVMGGLVDTLVYVARESGDTTLNDKADGMLTAFSGLQGSLDDYQASVAVVHFLMQYVKDTSSMEKWTGGSTSVAALEDHFEALGFTTDVTNHAYVEQNTGLQVHHWKFEISDGYNELVGVDEVHFYVDADTNDVSTNELIHIGQIYIDQLV